MPTAPRHYLPLLLTSVLLFLAFPAANLAPLAWIGLAPLVAVTAGARPLQTAVCFLIAGLGFHLLLLQWLLANVYWAGGWAVVGWFLLALLLGSYWAVCGAVWSFVRARVPLMGGAIGFGILWAAMEKIAEVLFSGFGWSALAYSQGPNLPLLQWASVGSTPLIGFFLATVGAAVGLIYAEKRARLVRAAGAVVLVIAAESAGLAMIEEPAYTDDPTVVGMFQSSFPLEMKWDAAYEFEMVRFATEATLWLDDTDDIDVMIWPEALVTGDMESEPIRGTVTSLARERKIELLTGASRRENGAFFNSMYAIDASGAFAGTYDKTRLAPFGEYVPLSKWLPFVDQLVPVIGAVNPGSELRVFGTGARTAGPLICFEMLFPVHAAELKERGADYLVVITNLSWFGASSAIPQELDITRVRAIETRMPIVHAANTGISGTIDPWGRFAGLEYVVLADGLYRARDSLTPRQTIRARMAGSTALPQPGTAPFERAPARLAWGFVALAGLIILAALVLGKRPHTDPAAP